MPKQQLGFGDPPRWLLYPVGYLTYVLARGAVDDWYPYFFVDVRLLGYGRAVLNAAALTLGTLAAGDLMVGAVRAVPRR